MTNPLHQSALASAATVLLYEVARAGAHLKPQHANRISREIIQRYLSESKNGIRPTQIVQETKDLASMAVGQIKFFTADCKKSVWRGRCRTARHIMANQAASWQVDLDDTRYKVTRLSDGAAPRKWRPPSDKAVFLAEMAPHDYRFAPWTKLEGAWKTTARRLLGEPEAQWKTRATTRGMKITRTC